MEARKTAPQSKVKSPPVKSTARDTLKQLTAMVRTEHQAILALDGKALDHAIRAGEGLSSIKRMTHSAAQSWSLWVTTNLQITKQQADTYIRVYTGRDRLGEMLAENRSIRRANDVLAGRADKYGVPIQAPEKEAASKTGPQADTTKFILIDPEATLQRAKAEGIKVQVSGYYLVELVNMILEEAGAGVLLTTEETEREMAEEY